MVFRDKLNSHGVVLLREKLTVDARLKRPEQIWPAVHANAHGSFMVITPQRVRVRPLTP